MTIPGFSKSIATIKNYEAYNYKEVFVVGAKFPVGDVRNISSTRGFIPVEDKNFLEKGVYLTADMNYEIFDFKGEAEIVVYRILT